MAGAARVRIALVAVTFHAGPSAAQHLFESPFIAYRGGQFGRSCALADFDADGRLDVAMACQGDDSVSLLLGAGDGTLRPRLDVSAGDGPIEARPCDLDEDGNLDLAVANYGAGSLAVLLGDGDGTFAPRIDYPNTAGLAEDVAIADLDADGFLDVVTAHSTASIVSILLGNGDGSLRPRTEFLLSDYAFALELADPNADGHQDVIVGGLSAVLVMFGHGDGTWEPAVAIGTVYYCKDIVSADLNGDGNLDLAAAEFNNGSWAVVLLGRGDGSFDPDARYAISERAWGIAAGDLNADGRPDLAVSATSAVVSVSLGNGDGTFGFDPAAADHDPIAAVATGDFDGDGNQDIVAAADTTCILRGHGDGSFAERATFGPLLRAGAIAVGDLDQDSRLDVLTANQAASISVFRGTGTGGFLPPESYAGPSPPTSIAVADVNRDGWPDVGVTDESSTPGLVSLWSNTGSGSLGPRTDLVVGPSPRTLAFADVDGDGWLDLLTACVDNGTVTGSVSIWRGGAGGFTGHASIPIGSAGNARLAAGDLNGDAAVDLAIAVGSFGPEGSRIEVLMGAGDGSFDPAAAIPIRGGSPSVAIADLDMDGRPDLAQTDYYGHGVIVHLGNGDGTFLPTVLYGATWYPTMVAVADFTSDGAPDLAVAASYICLLVNRLQVSGSEPEGWSEGAPEIHLDPILSLGSREPVRIRYVLRRPAAEVRLGIYDVRGRMLWATTRAAHEAGTFTQEWDRRTRSGAAVGRGVYFVQLRTTRAGVARKLTIAR